MLDACQAPPRTPGCPECARERATASAPPPPPPPPIAKPAIIVTPKPPSQPSHRSAGVAFALTAIPGFGHAYAGAWGRALLAFFILAPLGIVLTATHTIAPAFALGALALAAIDAYRVARARNGEWSPRRSADVRAALVAFGFAVILTSIARAAGVHASPLVALPVFMILFGLALAFPGRRSASAPPIERSKNDAPSPGEVLDRRVSRAELAAALAQRGERLS